MYIYIYMYLRTHIKVGVLICYDAEQPELVKEMVAEKPVLVLNPIMIPADYVTQDSSTGEQRSTE